MALDVNATLLANLVDPEVIGQMLDQKLFDYLKFTPLATIDTTLVGQPGSTIKLPYYRSIGDADIVAEGADIDIVQLTQDTIDATVAKAALGVQITDEAVLSGYGDPVGESVRQLAQAIASKIDNDLLAELQNCTLTTSFSGTTPVADDVADALAEFGEDIDGEKALLVDPLTYAALRKADDWLPASEIAARIWIRGAVGEIQGCQVIVTNRITDHNAYIVKPGALRLFLKRDTMIESDRDIINKSTTLTADKHYCVKLVDATKAVLIGTSSAPTEATTT